MECLNTSYLVASVLLQTENHRVYKNAVSLRFLHQVRATLYSLAGCYETDACDVGCLRYCSELMDTSPAPLSYGCGLLWPAYHAIDRLEPLPARSVHIRVGSTQVFLLRLWSTPQISQLLRTYKMLFFSRVANGEDFDTNVRADTR
jgi:hypothetical protein